MTIPLLRAAAVSAALLATACQRGPEVAPITCPPGAEVVVVQYPGERGGGHGERCELPGGVRQGPSYDYYDDGSLHSITSWLNGERHGKTTIWHRNGVKAEEFEHSHFIPVGMWTKWDDEGRVISQVDVGHETGNAPPTEGPAGTQSAPAPDAPSAPGS